MFIRPKCGIARWNGLPSISDRETCHPPKRSIFMRALSLFVMSCLVTASWAEMMAPSSIPAERVINNLESRIRSIPKDAESAYMLGRVYYTLYCTNDPRAIQVYGTAAAPRFPSEHTSPWNFRDRKPSSDRVIIKNLAESLRHLWRATQLGGGLPGLYSLTLACAYEAGIPDALKVEKGASEASFRQRALESYVRSFNESKLADQSRPYAQSPGTYEKWISVEAAESILRLDPQSPLKAEIADHLAQIAKLPGGPITPIIFSLERPGSLADLLDPTRRVKFDLDGTGAAQVYSWVRSDTAFLVWQPNPSHRIQSGRDLFGSGTWWLMPANGYAAMALLDDNRDGWLTGRELKGLAAWQDRNQNGLAEPNEVHPLARVGVTGLRTTYSARIGESYVSHLGLKMADGRVLPTYDWVTRNYMGL